MDPAPFLDRDLDPRAEEFIVGWASELPREAPLALLIHLDTPPSTEDAENVVRDAVHRFFVDRSLVMRRRLRALFHRGRLSLFIGLAFLSAAIGASQLLEQWLHPTGYIGILRESLLIGGWVAMWRPLEVFLYDWWPLRAEIRLFDRLATMPVRIKYGQ